MLVEDGFGRIAVVIEVANHQKLGSHLSPLKSGGPAAPPCMKNLPILKDDEICFRISGFAKAKLKVLLSAGGNRERKSGIQRKNNDFVQGLCGGMDAGRTPVSAMGQGW
jgi:hypothetical protein